MRLRRVARCRHIEASVECEVTLISGYQDASGTHGRFYEGTLHSLRVYKGCMTKEVCQAWVNQAE